jgi:hypothetical protein
VDYEKELRKRRCRNARLIGKIYGVINFEDFFLLLFWSFWGLSGTSQVNAFED